MRDPRGERPKTQGAALPGGGGRGRGGAHTGGVSAALKREIRQTVFTGKSDSGKTESRRALKGGGRGLREREAPATFEAMSAGILGGSRSRRALATEAIAYTWKTEDCQAWGGSQGIWPELTLGISLKWRTRKNGSLGFMTFMFKLCAWLKCNIIIN